VKTILFLAKFFAAVAIDAWLAAKDRRREGR